MALANSIWLVIAALSIAAASSPDLPQGTGYCAVPDAPSLHEDSSVDPTAFAERIVRDADAGGKLNVKQASQLLVAARELGESLVSGAVRDRWQQLQRRRKQRLELRRQCEQPQRKGQGDCKPKGAAPPGPSSEEGILVVAGGMFGFSNAYILIRALRHIGCNLPVEVVYYGPQEYHAPTARLLLDLDGSPGDGDIATGDTSDDDDYGWPDEDDESPGGQEGRGTCSADESAGGGGQDCDAAAAETIRRPTVRLIDGLAFHEEHLTPLLPHREPPGGIKGFATKVHALCFVTSFEKVLLLDSDNLAVQDPTPLFEDPAFTSHGNLFWPDFWTDMWINLDIYRLLNMPVPWEAGSSELAAEAGQVLLDRVMHYDVLEYLWLLATHPEVVGACVWGDKDTYRIAFHLAGKGAEYQALRQPPRQLLGQPPAAEGSPQGEGPMHHLGMAQLAPDGESIMFYHRTAAAKLFPHCIFRWANKMDACRPRFISLPVNQPQLLESVADPTEMVFQSKAVDLEWHKEHCKQPKQLKAAADAAGQGGEAARALLPECGEGWEGRRPIPLLPVELVPGFAGLMDWVHSEVFLPLLAYHANTRRS